MLKLKKRQGASSILILFTVIILITLGLFTIVSASVNFDQSVRNNNWIRSYYELDTYGETLLSKVDEALFNAEQEAVNYVMNAEYLKDNASTIPQSIHDTNKLVYNNNIENVYNVLNNTYKSLAIEYLKPLEDVYNGKVVAVYNEDGSVYSLFFTCLLDKYDQTDYGLSIKLNVEDILYDISINDGFVTGKKIDFKSRYLVTKWQVYQ